jgi:hypothetical protein
MAAHSPRDVQRGDDQQQKEAGPKGDALHATIHSAAVVCAIRSHAHNEADQKRLDR